MTTKTDDPEIAVRIYQDGQWLMADMPEPLFLNRVNQGDLTIMKESTYQAMLKNHPNVHFATAEEAANLGFDEYALGTAEALEALKQERTKGG